jgi:hypothetical protein
MSGGTLAASREPSGRDPREVIREEPLMRTAILASMSDEGRTIPEIAVAIGYPAHEVLFWVMAMRRYGYVREVKTGAQDGYFRYEHGPRAGEAR